MKNNLSYKKPLKSILLKINSRIKAFNNLKHLTLIAILSSSISCNHKDALPNMMPSLSDNDENKEEDLDLSSLKPSSFTKYTFDKTHKHKLESINIPKRKNVLNDGTSNKEAKLIIQNTILTQNLKKNITPNKKNTKYPTLNGILNKEYEDFKKGNYQQYLSQKQDLTLDQKELHEIKQKISNLNIPSERKKSLEVRLIARKKQTKQELLNHSTNRMILSEQYFKLMLSKEDSIKKIESKIQKRFIELEEKLNTIKDSRNKLMIVNNLRIPTNIPEEDIKVLLRKTDKLIRNAKKNMPELSDQMEDNKKQYQLMNDQNYIEEMLDDYDFSD